MNLDYRESHKNPGKGESYAESFAECNYKALIWSWEKEILQKILKKYLNKSRSEINYLDFACGTGRITEIIESKVGEAYGVDVSDEMLSVAKKKLKRTKLINTDLTKNNNLYQTDETHITEDQIIGKAIFRIPLLGWVKIIFEEIINAFR